jgi:excisionase family DNA binding protein
MVDIAKSSRTDTGDDDRRELERESSPRAFSIAAFCRRYAIGRTYAYQEIAAGRLHAVKAGRRTLITRDAAEAWLASLPELKKPNPINIEEEKTQRSAQAD